MRQLHLGILVLVLALLCSVGAVGAKADTFNITAVGPQNAAANDYTLTFPTTATVAEYSTADYEIASVAWAINGVAQTPTYLDFYATSQGGGISFGGGAEPFVNLYGPQLFSGDGNAGTFAFLTGDYTLWDGGALGAGNTYAVNFVDPPGDPTPESSTLVSLAVGVALLAGFALHQRRRESFETAIG